MSKVKFYVGSFCIEDDCDSPETLVEMIKAKLKEQGFHTMFEGDRCGYGGTIFKRAQEGEDLKEVVVDLKLVIKLENDEDDEEDMLEYFGEA